MKKAKICEKRPLKVSEPQEVTIGCSGTRIVHHLVSASSLQALIATNKNLWEEG